MERKAREDSCGISVTGRPRRRFDTEEARRPLRGKRCA
ncbi:hypothetical protein SD77_3542 [Bacillus badius]|uniref:Ribose 5-phosphate isomerase B n=1 Tax=Bacillus badius TaxID=1455 RepID=A0ABR5AWJ2_BACBA|nr:hypothetical protein SD77_3542 [Bacillus badius]